MRGQKYKRFQRLAPTWNEFAKYAWVTKTKLDEMTCTRCEYSNLQYIQILSKTVKHPGSLNKKKVGHATKLHRGSVDCIPKKFLLVISKKNLIFVVVLIGLLLLRCNIHNTQMSKNRWEKNSKIDQTEKIVR